MIDPSFVMRVLRAFNRDDGADQGDLWWHWIGGDIVFMVECGDLFYDGIACSFSLVEGSIHILEQSIRDLIPHDATEYATQLFSARIRESRPLRRRYTNMPEDIHYLFDACGPERIITRCVP